MFNNTVLDIAIGLVLMYLVLSLMGTVINEFISTAISLRAKTLKSALQTLLDDPKLKDAFYNHGLIDGAKQTAGDPSYLNGQTFALAIIGGLTPDTPLPAFDDIKKAIGDLNVNSNIRDALLSQVSNADGDLTRLRNNIANYFDSTMDRVSGVYKRYLKWISLAVGFVIVILLNADSIKVGQSLWNDSSLRAQIVANSGTFVKAGIPSTDVNSISPTALGQQLGKLEDNIRPLPIGLTQNEVAYLWSAVSGNQHMSWSGFWWFLSKLFGLSITAFAISLGAPFWFDMLSKFMNVRGTGAKPDATAITEIKQPPGPTLTITTQQPLTTTQASPGKS